MCAQRGVLTHLKQCLVVAPKVTVDLLKGYLQDGRGTGHGEEYQSFIQLKRWNASPVSVQTFGSAPPFARRMHLLSRSEWLIAILLSWIGCHVREQMPLWPWRSPSPLYGYHPDLDPLLGWHSGSLALCKAAGIKHGVYVGTSIPYIWTLDLVATMAWLPPDMTRAVFVSIKPLASEPYSGDIDPLARGPEKLEIERRIAGELGCPYFVADRTLYPGPLLGQLEWLKSAAVLPDGHAASRGRNLLLDARGNSLTSEPPISWRDRLVKDYNLPVKDADLAVQNILWSQSVDVDLTREIQMEDVVRPGGRRLKAALRKCFQESCG